MSNLRTFQLEIVPARIVTADRPKSTKESDITVRSTAASFNMSYLLNDLKVAGCIEAPLQGLWHTAPHNQGYLVSMVRKEGQRYLQPTLSAYVNVTGNVASDGLAILHRHLDSCVSQLVQQSAMGLIDVYRLDVLFTLMGLYDAVIKNLPQDATVDEDYLKLQQRLYSVFVSSSQGPIRQYYTLERLASDLQRDIKRQPVYEYYPNSGAVAAVTIDGIRRHIQSTLHARPVAENRSVSITADEEVSVITTAPDNKFKKSRKTQQTTKAPTTEAVGSSSSVGPKTKPKKSTKKSASSQLTQPETLVVDNSSSDDLLMVG